MSTVNILLDCQVTMAFAPQDLGGGEVYSNTLSFKVDKVSVKETVSSTDHSTAQDFTMMHRQTKVDWEITFETKLYDAALVALVRDSALGACVVTASQGGLGVSTGSGGGLITGFEVDYAGPSTCRWGLKAHGTQLTYN